LEVAEETRQKRPWRRITDEVRREVIQLLRTGLSPNEIARCLGRSPTTIYNLIKETGGVFRAEEIESGFRLSAEEREEIFRGLLQGDSIRQIARGLKRAPSTISREVNANGGRNGYRPLGAHKQAQKRRLRPRPAKLLSCARLRGEVEAGLMRHWSPQQISRFLVHDHPDDAEMRVSHETIYQSLFVQARGALRKDLTQYLRSGKTVRRSPSSRVDGRGVLKDMIMISDRPAEVEDRAVPGHWEGDLILGKNGKSAIGTLVERWSRYVMLLYLPDGHDAEAVLKALTAKVQTLPASLRRTLTWDQGKEMAQHLAFTMATDMQVYFCDPHHPWQRGSNENTNGLLRQYFPKGTDLSVHSEEYLDFVADEMNGRPRETLGWRKPCEKLAEAVAMAA
jgi:IS30 family transposase